jgi:hypothetical protein
MGQEGDPIMTRSRLLFVSTMVLFGIGPTKARAQDSQYWTQQYGPVAELLGGVVVGSTRDLSATFYNPGALSLTKDPSLLASVQSFEATKIKATSTTPVIDFQDTSVRPSPSLFAFALPRSWTGSHTLAISSLTRQDFDLRVDNWQVTPTAKGGAESLFDQSLTESWFGLSWAHKAGEQFGLGVTTYVAYRGQRTRKEVSGAGAVSPSQGGAGLLIEDFDYSNYRLLWKAGLATHRESWDLGLTVTTQSVRLFGSGEASYVNASISGDPNGSEAAVAVQHQDSLTSRYESPWSVAGGGAYRKGQNSFHATVEWFDKVGGYDVLDTSSFASSASAAGLVKRLHSQAKSVVNFGLGYERRVSERFSYYGALTSDFTYADKGDSGSSALSTWDIYHVTAGTSLMVGNVKVTMGAAYAFGSDTRSVSTLFVPPGGEPVPTQTPLDVRLSKLRVLVGFDFGK